jgi:hypothetical protein
MNYVTDARFSGVKLRTDVRPEGFLKELLLSPLLYIRVAGILFSLIVFGCVADQGYHAQDATPLSGQCLYNESGACGYIIAIGVLAFIICLVFMTKDVGMIILDFSGNIFVKKIVIIIDMSVNGLWAFLWFVGFCYTADQYRNNNPMMDLNPAQVNNLQAAIAFSFFSILLWISIIALNALYLVWIFKGTDRDTKPGGGYSGFDHQDIEEDREGEPEDKTSNPPVYTPPEY